MNSKDLKDNQDSLTAVSGDTNFGTELSGIDNGHLLFTLNSNDEKDSFNFVAKKQYQNDNYSNLLSIKSNGNIGINNNDPSYNLDINGKLRIKSENESKSTINFLDLDGTLASKITYQNNNLLFNNKNDNSILTLLCDDTKKVGINNNDPTSQLDINGNSIRIRVESSEPNSSTIGEKGEIRWSQEAIYLCLGLDGTSYKWKKALLQDL